MAGSPTCRPGDPRLGLVDSRGEIREFLASRRARIPPVQVGVETSGGKRRVPGLRRAEVAQLAGVRLHRTGVTRFRHPVVGDLELTFNAMDLPGQPGLTLKAYTAAAGSPSEDGLELLASWAATNTEPARQP